MKLSHCIWMLFPLVIACGEEKIVKEVPNEIIPSKPCGTLFNNISKLLRESKNNRELYGVLFTDTIQKKIILTKETEVFVTFISEGAGFKNTLGWYAYDASNPPTSSAAIKKNILFPHISKNVLNQGDMLQLGSGKFKAGTVIGFFMIIRGWNDGIINYNNKTYYTNSEWNVNQDQQHVLFAESTCADIVMTFEDKLEEENSDLDYNDVIFTISDNRDQLQTVSIDLQSIVGL